MYKAVKSGIKMPDYNKSKIYKLWSPLGDLTYIGSTIQTLPNRLWKHKCDYKRYMDGKRRFVSSFELFQNYDDVRIELVCECPCDNVAQLRAIEGRYIRQLDCVNRCVAGRTKKQYHIDNREKDNERCKKWHETNKGRVKQYQKNWHKANKDSVRQKQSAYYQKNAEVIKQYQKDYNKNNKEKVAKSRKAYRDANKQKIADRDKAYRERNKEAIKARRKAKYDANKDKIKAKDAIKVKCECGCTITKKSLKRHQRTAKHKKLMEAKDF
jgi:hypothetical protein